MCGKDGKDSMKSCQTVPRFYISNQKIKCQANNSIISWYELEQDGWLCEFQGQAFKINVISDKHILGYFFYR